MNTKSSPAEVAPVEPRPAREERIVPPQGIGEIIQENVLAPYRERILYPIGAIATLVLLPLSIGHLVEGNKAIAGLLFVLVAMLGIDVAATSRGKRLPIPFPVLLLPAAIAVVMALAVYGLYGALWSFPLAMISFFVLRRRAANIAGIALVVLGAVLLYLFHDLGLALRFMLSLGLVLVITNILLEVTETAHAKLLSQSVTDSSTGAYNRRHMETCVRHVLERHLRTGATASLLALDIDRFAKVNDRFGVGGADRVLRALADLVRVGVRPQDLVFRAGGQQFIVLLPDTSTDQAMTVAEQLRGQVAKAKLAEAHPITMSVGVSELRAFDSPESWLKRVNQAMRSAKDEGRNRVMGERSLQHA